MQEGLTLALSGTTLMGVLGLAVKIWMKDRPQKIEQPLEVRTAQCSLSKEQCNERHHEIDKWRDNMYLRMIEMEKSRASDKATQAAIEKRLDSIDAKLDRMIEAKE